MTWSTNGWGGIGAEVVWISEVVRGGTTKIAFRAVGAECNLQCHSVTPRALASCIQHPPPRRVICFPQPLVDITIVQSLHCHFTHCVGASRYSHMHFQKEKRNSLATAPKEQRRAFQGNMQEIKAARSNSTLLRPCRLSGTFMQSTPGHLCKNTI